MTTQKTTIASRASRKKGFTLTEIAIVLGIIGLILGAIWVAASNVYQNQRVAKATTELISLAQGIRSLYATQSVIDTQAAGFDETSAIINAGVFPTDSLTGAAGAQTANGPWAGSTIKVYNSTDESLGDSFQVQFINVPSSACVQLETSSTGTGRDSGLVSVDTNAPTTGAYKAPVFAAMPISVNTANGNCGNANADVSFTFKLKG